MQADRDPNKLYPVFREIVAKVLVEANLYAEKHMQGYRWEICEGYRSAKRQNELYQQGRTKPGAIVTYKDGYKKRSNHQTSLAVDIVPKHGYSFDWNIPKKHWEYLGHLARKHGLTWGGDWDMKDYPHLEYPLSKTTYRAAKTWQKRLGL